MILKELALKNEFKIYFTKRTTPLPMIPTFEEKEIWFGSHGLWSIGRIFHPEIFKAFRTLLLDFSSLLKELTTPYQEGFRGELGLTGMTKA